MLSSGEKTHVLTRLGFELTPEQAAVAADESLVRLVAGGERAGKSLLAGAEVAAAAFDASLIWLVGPDYAQARAEFGVAHNALAKLSAVETASTPTEGRSFMRLRSGTEIETKSAEDVLKLAGKAPSLIVMCEAAQQDFDTFRRLFGRTVEGRAKGDGAMLLVGTFEKGRRWYAELFRQLKGPNPYGGRSFSLPTWSNRAIFPGGRSDPAIAAIEAGLASEMFRERFGGEPVAHEDQVFRGESVEKCIGPLGEGDGYNVMGVDLARVRDYTVLHSLNSKRETIDLQRFHRIDWTLQVQRIVETCRRLGVKRVVVDSTGVGDPIAETLWRSRLSVEPVKITAQSKAELIDRLAILLDQGRVRIPRDETLIGELWDFSATELASGRDRLEAPSGKNDDHVIALALACHGLQSIRAEVPIQKPRVRETPPGAVRPISGSETEDELIRRVEQAERAFGYWADGSEHSPWAT